MNGYKHKGYNDIPGMLSFFIEMKYPNEDILIYEGEFILQGKEKIQLVGKIQFKWFPLPKVYFEGISEKPNMKVFPNLVNQLFKIEIDDFDLGNFIVNKEQVVVTAKESYIKVEGIANSDIIFGESTLTASSIRFDIPNLRYLGGSEVLDRENSKWGSRIKICTDEYEIFIDRLNDKESKKNLEKTGGFFNTYTGQIKKIKGQSISIDEARKVLLGLNYFISLLNGRRTSALFIRGMHEDEALWTDYSSYIVDRYKYVQSWTGELIELDYSKLFNNFYKLWKDEVDRNFIKSLTGWYLESNRYIEVESSIVKAQIGLELLYNYLLIEKQGLLLDNDAHRLSAANKIRLLLNYLQVEFDIPKELSNLSKYLSEKNKVKDAPGIIVQIRNSLVHGEKTKREEIAKIDNKTKIEVLHLCIWYIELAIMSILKHDGFYLNRCKNGYLNQVKDSVPWRR